MSNENNYAIDPKEWLAAIVNARFNQFTLTAENTTVVSVNEVLGRPNEAIVILQVDRNVGMVEGIGLVPYAKPYIKRRIKIVRKVGQDVAKSIHEDGVLRVATATKPTNTLDVVKLVNEKYNLNILDADVHNVTVTNFGSVDLTFRANSFGYWGKMRVYVSAATLA